MVVVGEKISFGIPVVWKINFVEIGKTQRDTVHLNKRLGLRTAIEFTRNRCVGLEYRRLAWSGNRVFGFRFWHFVDSGISCYRGLILVLGDTCFYRFRFFLERAIRWIVVFLQS